MQNPIQQIAESSAPNKIYETHAERDITSRYFTDMKLKTGNTMAILKRLEADLGRSGHMRIDRRLVELERIRYELDRV